MDLNNIAEQVTITVVSATVLWLGSRLAMTIWSKTAQLAARLRNTYQNNALVSARAKERMEAMREFTLVLCFVSMLGLQIRATGPVPQTWDVVMLCTWTWCLLTTLLHIARKK